MKKLVFIKLGGSLLTDKTFPYKLDEKFISTLPDLLPISIRKKNTDFIIGTGAGSFGHFEAKKYNLSGKITSPDQLIGACQTHLGVQRLSQIVAKKLTEGGWPAFTFSPSALFVSKNGEANNVSLAPLELALKNKFTPIVHGETILDSQNKIKIFSTEDIALTILDNLYEKYDEIMAIFLTNVDGVMHDNELIPFINHDADLDDLKFFWNDNYDVSGSMISKVEISQTLARRGVQTIIANGRKIDIVRRILNGEKVGTAFRAC